MNNEQLDFRTAFKGSFSGILRWHQLDALWERMRADAQGGWYLYAVGEAPPAECATRDDLLRFIDESGIAAICADNPMVEKIEGVERCSDAALLPLHEHCLVKLGIHLGELWWFGALAAWLRAHGRSAFLLTAPPLRLPGAVGSPVTPVATV